MFRNSLFRLVCSVAASIALLPLGACSRKKASLRVEGSLNLGAVGEGVPAISTLALVNDSAQMLTVARTEVSCGCLTTGLAAGTAISPGNRLPFEVRLSTNGREGEVQQTVFVHWREQGAAPMAVPLTVQVHKVISIEGLPSDSLMATVGETAPETLVTMEWLDGKPHEITAAKAVEGNVTVKLETVEAGKRYHLRIQPDTSHSRRVWQDEIILSTTHPEMPERRIPLSGTVVGSVSAEPALWNLGALKLGQPDTTAREFIVKLQGHHAFSVKEVDSSRIPSLTITSVQSAPDRWTLRLSLDVGNLTGGAKPHTLLNGKVLIHTDLPDEEPLELPVLAVFSDSAPSAKP